MEKLKSETIENKDQALQNKYQAKQMLQREQMHTLQTILRDNGTHHISMPNTGKRIMHKVA
jgi:hypothetical protein